MKDYNNQEDSAGNDGEIIQAKIDDSYCVSKKLKDIESQQPMTPKAPPAFPNPVILGAASFSCTDFILSTSNAGLLPPTVTSGIIGAAFFYGGIIQVFTGLCFITRNTFGLLTLTSYGAFWIAVATLITLENEGVLVFGADASMPIGMLAIGYAILTCYLWLATFNHNLTLCILIFMVDVQLILTAFSSFGVMSTVPAGVAGLFVAANGWYFSMALFINENYGKHIMPVGEPQTTPLFRIIYKGIYGP